MGFDVQDRYVGAGLKPAPTTLSLHIIAEVDCQSSLGILGYFLGMRLKA